MCENRRGRHRTGTERNEQGAERFYRCWNLGNIQERLNQAYGEEHQFEIHSSPGAGFYGADHIALRNTGTDWNAAEEAEKLAQAEAEPAPEEQQEPVLAAQNAAGTMPLQQKDATT